MQTTLTLKYICFLLFCSLFKLLSSRGKFNQPMQLCFVCIVPFICTPKTTDRKNSTPFIFIDLGCSFRVFFSLFLGLCIKIVIFKFILFKTSRKTYQLVVSVYCFPIESYRSYRVFVLHLFSINHSS